MKKIVIWTILILFFAVPSFACVGPSCDKDSNVGDTNDGNRGYIFTYDCEKGNESLGKWVDPSFLKGDKGDKGDVGPAGQDGTNGVDGKNGLNGTNGENGVDGQNGQNGLDGEQGLQGVQGEIGLTGSTGETGSQGEQGIHGNTGSKGDTGVEGDVGLTGPQGKGLEDRQEGIIELRVLDTKNTTWSIYNGYDFNNEVNITGVKVTIKFGTSYEEREIKKLQQRIEALEVK